MTTTRLPTGLGPKLRATVAVAALAACLIGAAGLLVSGRLHAANRAYVDEVVRPVQALALVHQAEIKSRLDLYRVATAKDAAARARWTASSRDDDSEVADGQSRFAPHATGALAAPYAAFRDGWAAWTAYRDATALPLAARGDLPGLTAAMDGRGNALISTAVDGLDATEAAMATLTAQRDAAQDRSFTSGRTLLLVALGVGLTLTAVLCEVLVRSVLRRLRAVRRVAVALADGDLTERAEVHGTDELADVAGATNRAADAMSEAVQGLVRSSRALSTSSERLSSVSQDMAASAEQTAAQAGRVSAVAEQVSQSVRTASTGADEMGDSIREIAQSAGDAALVASEAVDAARRTNDAIAKLGTSSSEISDVVAVITSIAQQTNLLALNATIEAARAGEAGKGFAVVAHEVKDLAQETARATSDVATRIAAIQADTGEAVGAIEQIGRVIGRISDHQTTIASAVEEQTATTREMSRNVARAAAGSGEIAAGITGVAEAAATTSGSLAESRQAAGELAVLSRELDALVGRFSL